MCAVESVNLTSLQIYRDDHEHYRVMQTIVVSVVVGNVVDLYSTSLQKSHTNRTDNYLESNSKSQSLKRLINL